MKDYSKFIINESISSNDGIHCKKNKSNGKFGGTWYSLLLVDKDGVTKENITLFVIDGKLSKICSYNNTLGLRPFIKNGRTE